MPELHASRRAPPPTTAAPTPAARNRLRRETPRRGGRCCRVLSGGQSGQSWSGFLLDIAAHLLRRGITSG